MMGPWSKHVKTIRPRPYNGGPWHVVAELLLEPHRDAAVVPYKNWEMLNGGEDIPYNVNPGLINHGLLIRGVFPQ